MGPTPSDGGVDVMLAFAFDTNKGSSTPRSSFTRMVSSSSIPGTGNQPVEMWCSGTRMTILWLQVADVYVHVLFKVRLQR
jgi:hypothetical protein